MQKVIGEFEIEYIINENIDTLWRKTRHFAGIDKDYFNQYFAEKENGFAIKINKIKKYNKPRCLKKDYNLTPPQSFLYLDAC
ncbi:MAG: hypothetical protein ACLQQ4_11240 [Bacteroidia bacterium]